MFVHYVYCSHITPFYVNENHRVHLLVLPLSEDTSVRPPLIRRMGREGTPVLMSAVSSSFSVILTGSRKKISNAQPLEGFTLPVYTLVT